MIIYKAEQDVEGLVERILSNSSIAYTTEVVQWEAENRQKVFDAVASINYEAIKSNFSASKASIMDSDLYFTKSILVTTNWNKNDDVFTRANVWAARHTPSHKRTNLEHNEKILVGHITDTWALTADGAIIPDNSTIDDLPNLYHIANGAVIYMSWEDKELEARASELVKQIEKGEKFVSMETSFTSFDYAVMTPDGDFHVVARKEDTAFLTKHLKSYGGNGEFDGCKIGRLLQNMTFSGKGYVDRPANPYSVIFNDSKVLNFTSASQKNPFEKKNGVFCCRSENNHVQMEKKDMSDTLSVDLLQKQNEELKTTVANLREEVKLFSKSSIDEKIISLESKISVLETQLTVANTEKETALAKVSELTEANKSIDEQLKDVSEAKASLEAKISKIEAEKVIASRVSCLVDAGYAKEVAEAKVSIFANLNDEQFNAVAKELSEAKKFGKKEDEENDKDKSSKADEDPTADANGEAAASEETLDNAVANTEPAMSADASAADDSVESLREELRKALAARLGIDQDDKKNSSGE